LKTLTSCQDYSSAIVENLGEIGITTVQYILICDVRSRLVGDSPVDDSISRSIEDDRDDTVSIR
jgi:hypothetical protein